ncbi:rhodanese-related sulfurtransferase, partial [Salmonella enterica]
MPLKVAAFYQFAALPDFRALREPLRALCAELELKGSVLLAHEGING